MNVDQSLMIVISLLLLLGLLALGLGNTLVHLIAKISEWIKRQ